MSTETRTVRPYAGLDGLQRIVNNEFALHVGPERVAPGESLTLTAEGFLLREIAVEMSSSDELFEVMQLGLAQHLASIGFNPADLELVVIASSPYMKIADVLVRCPLDRLAPLGRRLVLSSPKRPRALSSPRSGCAIDVYVVLSHDVPQVPLRPWRRGTWFARASFSLSSELAPIGFTPRPLTAQARKDLGNLSDDTIRFIQFEDDDTPLTVESSTSSLAIYVDEVVLAKLSASSETPASQLFQLQLFLDAVAEILRVAREQEGFGVVTLEDLEDTLFGRLLDGLSRHAQHTPVQRLEAQLALLSHAKNQPHVFMAHAEAAVGYRKLLNEVLDQ